MIQLQTHVCLVTSTLCGVIQQRFEVIALYDQIHYDCGDGTGKLRCCWQSLLVRQQNSLDIVTWFVWQWLPTSLKHFLTVSVRFLGTDIHTKNMSILLRDHQHWASLVLSNSVLTTCDSQVSTASASVTGHRYLKTLYVPWMALDVIVAICWVVASSLRSMFAFTHVSYIGHLNSKIIIIYKWQTMHHSKSWKTLGCLVRVAFKLGVTTPWGTWQFQGDHVMTLYNFMSYTLKCTINCARLTRYISNGSGIINSLVSVDIVKETVDIVKEKQPYTIGDSWLYLFPRR